MRQNKNNRKKDIITGDGTYSKQKAIISRGSSVSQKVKYIQIR